MKKVLFISTELGNTNTSYIPFLDKFIKDGFEIHIVGPDKKKLEYNYKYFELKFTNFNMKRKIQVYKIIKRLIRENNYEIIYCYGHVIARMVRFVIKTIRKKCSSKIIYETDNFQVHNTNLYHYIIERHFLKYTDILITNNREYYNWAKLKSYIKNIYLVEKRRKH